MNGWLLSRVVAVRRRVRFRRTIAVKSTVLTHSVGDILMSSRRVIERPSRRWAQALIVAALALTACQPDVTPTSAPTVAPTTTPTAAPATVAPTEAATAESGATAASTAEAPTATAAPVNAVEIPSPFSDVNAKPRVALVRELSDGSFFERYLAGAQAPISPAPRLRPRSSASNSSTPAPPAIRPSRSPTSKPPSSSASTPSSSTTAAPTLSAPSSSRPSTPASRSSPSTPPSTCPRSLRSNRTTSSSAS